MSFLGVDVGTSQTKAIAYDGDFRPLAESSAAYQRTVPQPGWCELDPQALLEAVRQVVSCCAEECRREPIHAVSFSVFGGGVTAVDSALRPLLPILSTTDNRAQGEAEWWAAHFGREKTYRIAGTTTHTSLMLPKALWIRKYSPVAAKIHWFLTAAELVTAEMGVPVKMDWATASTTMLLDIQRRQWSPEILEAAAIDPDMLPPVVASGAILGQVPASVAARLHLSPGCLVVAGGHDQQVCALGAGLVNPGAATDSLGTVECLTTLFERPLLAESFLAANFSNLLHVHGGRIATLAYNFSGGDLLAWYRDTFAPGESLEDALARLPDRPSSLLVLPHFVGSGTPHMDARSKGAVLGLSLATRREEILQAIVESQSYEMRQNLDLWRAHGIAPQRLLAYGKGASSDAILQVKADVLGLPIERLAVRETGCLGAALLAAQAVETDFRLEETLRRVVRPEKVFAPQADRVDAYAGPYERYRQLYPALRELHHRM